MTAYTFRAVYNSKAGDSRNWTPAVPTTGPFLPTDTLIMNGGVMYLQPGDLDGHTLTLGTSQAASTEAITLSPNVVLTTTTAPGSTINATLEVEGRATATLSQSYPSTANYTVNINPVNGDTNATWLGTYIGALSGSLTVNGPVGAVFENDDTSVIGGTHAVINADVIGTGSFQDSTAQGQTGTLEFGRSVATSETVDMVGNPARGTGNVKLLIDRPQDFHAAVTLYDGTITLKNLTADSYSYDNAALTLYKAGAVVDTLRLHNLTTDGSPGASITPLFVSQNGSDIEVFSEAGVTPSNPLPFVQQHVASVAIFDTTTNSAVPDTLSQPYTGSVAGLQTQFVDITPNSLNITALKPNMFIHTGGGNDAIALLSGTNVADGGGGSNFLTGGTGTDTFFVDARGAVQDIWSTVSGFHSGDAATLWGVSPTADMLSWSNNGGAAGYTGLTLHATAAGQPTASITLAGFSQADLASGKLTTSFGSTSGGDYLYLHAA